ncbi:hypothetical protein ASZ78_010996 [Callipepla squamata]|uniref:Uncharacterized protein n=1 Tax=Callipepla squamata TaxID=9009 RepID=A0A226NEW3_CALSU|nr:hypothetical protein ASZ78_010996 [Callipepla squamata]
MVPNSDFGIDLCFLSTYFGALDEDASQDIWQSFTGSPGKAVVLLLVVQHHWEFGGYLCPAEIMDILLTSTEAIDSSTHDKEGASSMLDMGMKDPAFWIPYCVLASWCMIFYALMDYNMLTSSVVMSCAETPEVVAQAVQMESMEKSDSSQPFTDDSDQLQTCTSARFGKEQSVGELFDPV